MLSNKYKELYQADIRKLPRRTKENTGNLAPDFFDFLHAPWIELQVVNDDGSQIKKTLVFADHDFYQRLDDISRIKTLLTKFKNEGFRCLIVYSNNTVVEHEPEAIPDHYSLSYEHYPLNHIYDLVWQQHQIPAENCFILDLVGINSICENSVLYLPRLSAEAISYLSRHPRARFCFDINASLLNRDSFIGCKSIVFSIRSFSFPTPTDVLLTVSCLESPQSNSTLLQQISAKLQTPSAEKSILENLQISPEKLVSLLATTKVSEIKICGSMSAFTTDDGIMKGSLQQLEQLSINESLLEQEFRFFLTEAPNLTSVTFDLTEFNNYELFAHLKKLSHIQLYEVVPKYLSTLFSSLPALEEANVTCIANEGPSKEVLFATPLENTLHRLNSFTLGTLRNPKWNINIFNLAKSAPNLHFLQLGYSNIIPVTPINLSHICLQLKELRLEDVKIHDVANFINVLAQIAPNLQSLYLMKCNLHFTTSKIDKKLPIVFLSLQKMRMSIREFDFALGCAEHLTTLAMEHIDFIKSPECNDYKLTTRPRLKSLSWYGSPSPNSFVNFNEILTAITNLEYLEIFYLGDKPLVFELPEKSLCQLQVLKVTADMSASAVANLLRAAPNVQVAKLVLRTKKYSESDLRDILAISPRANIDLRFNPPQYNTAVTKKVSKPQIFELRQQETTTHTVTRYFPNIKTRRYRLKVFFPKLDTLDLSISEPKDFSNIALQNDFDANDYQIEPGIKPINISDGITIILPSLNYNEKVFDVSLTAENGDSFPCHNIQRSKSTGLHRVVLPYAGNFTVYFKVAIPRRIADKPEWLLTQEKKYQAFTSKDLTLPAVSSLKELITYIETYQTGSCFYRALAAYSKICEFKPPVPCAIVENDEHAFPEVHVAGNCFALEVGGYRAKIQEVTPLKYTPKDSPENTFGRYIQQTKQPEFITISAKQSRELPHVLLIEINGETAYQEALSLLNAKTAFIAYKPHNLNLSASGLTQQGIFKQNYTRLQRALLKVPSAIIINICGWPDDDIAKLNDVLDGRLEELNQLNYPIRIINTSHHYSPDFIRRVPYKMSVTSHINLLEKVPDKVVATSTRTFELFESPFWQRILFGFWQLLPAPYHPPEFIFRWFPGELTTLCRSDQKAVTHIVFKNPPLTDPSFLDFIAELKTTKQFEWADQTAQLPAHIHLSQSQGYDWESLAEIAEFVPLKVGMKPYILSDNKLLAFIQTLHYEYNETDDLTAVKGYLFRDKLIAVICSPDLSESALAQFLSCAKQRGVKIQFTISHAQHLSKALIQISKYRPLPKNIPAFTPPHLEWEIHSQPQSATREILKHYPQAAIIDLRSFNSAELSRSTTFNDEDRKSLFATNRFKQKAPLSTLIRDLLFVKDAVLTLMGNITNSMIDTLLPLILGTYENKPIKGRVILLSPPENSNLMNMFIGDRKPGVVNSALTVAMHASNATTALTPKPRLLTEPNDRKMSDALEDMYLKQLNGYFAKTHLVVVPQISGSIWPYVLKMLPEQNCHYTVKSWLEAVTNQFQYLIIDLAQLAYVHADKGGIDFLTRFANFPSFVYMGKNYTLSKHHKVIIKASALSIASNEFLQSQLIAEWEFVPCYYVRARLLENISAHIFSLLTDIYNWGLANLANGKLLITDKVIHFLQFRIALHRDDEVLVKKMIYDFIVIILNESPSVLNTFKEKFNSWNQQVKYFYEVPNTLFNYQAEAYSLVIDMFHYNKIKKPAHFSGFSGIVLQGASEIGKTHFLLNVTHGQQITRISPSTPVSEKEKKLSTGCVVAEEFNVGHWPPCLTHYLAGADVNGKPSISASMLFLASQNPPSSFKGRTAINDASEYLITLQVNWPVVSSSKISTEGVARYGLLPSGSRKLFPDPEEKNSSHKPTGTNTFIP